MTSKFAALAAKVDEGFKVFLINPATGKRITDSKGNAAYIEVLSGDSEAAEKFDRDRQRKANENAAASFLSGAASDEGDAPELVAKIAALTIGWHLVDPATGTVIDVPCNSENALDLYNDRQTRWIYRQVMPQAATIANFMAASSKG